MNRLILFVLLIFLTGCASVNLISERGNFLTYEHGRGKESFEEVYKDAASRCEAKWLVAMQTSTNCPGRCVTNFECVKK